MAGANRRVRRRGDCIAYEALHIRDASSSDGSRQVRSCRARLASQWRRIAHCIGVRERMGVQARLFSCRLLFRAAGATTAVARLDARLALPPRRSLRRGVPPAVFAIGLRLDVCVLHRSHAHVRERGPQAHSCRPRSTSVPRYPADDCSGPTPPLRRVAPGAAPDTRERERFAGAGHAHEQVRGGTARGSTFPGAGRRNEGTFEHAIIPMLRGPSALRRAQPPRDHAPLALRPAPPRDPLPP